MAFLLVVSVRLLWRNGALHGLAYCEEDAARGLSEPVAEREEGGGKVIEATFATCTEAGFEALRGLMRRRSACRRADHCEVE